MPHPSPMQYRPVRVSLTNVTGMGTTQLVGSLLPALERAPGFRIDEIYLPDRGILADYRRLTVGPTPQRYLRRLPNPVSRFLECTVRGGQFDGVIPLLVLGDVPIRCKTRQVVFVQTPHLAESHSGGRWTDFYNRGARAVFRANASYASAFIVQTPVMKAALARAHPGIAERVHVVPQPPPSWLIDARLTRSSRIRAVDAPLRLGYPAAGYVHKNHALLGRIAAADAASWNVERLTVTIPEAANPNPALPWISCVGALDPAGVLALYRDIDALLFLSLEESFGIPLVEAMWIGLPIVCPDLPYARVLCGAQAIYFDPASAASLRAALETLHGRLAQGWWPDWREQIATIPRDWDTVARRMLEIVSP